MRAGLGDVPVAGQGGEAEAVEVKVEQGGEFEGAQDRRDGQLGVAAASFGGQERVFEGSIVGDQDAAAWHRRQVLGDVGVTGLAGASMAGVRPWMLVGPGSTPRLSRVYIEFSIEPSAVMVSAATLSTRAAAGSKPDVSTSTTTKSLAVFISSASPPAPTRRRNRLARSALPSQRQTSGQRRAARQTVRGVALRISGLVDCYQIVTGELSDFPLPSFVTFPCRAVGILVCTPPLRGR